MCVQIYLSNQTTHGYEYQLCDFFHCFYSFGDDQCLGLKLVSDEVN